MYHTSASYGKPTGIQQRTIMSKQLYSGVKSETQIYPVLGCKLRRPSSIWSQFHWQLESKGVWDVLLISLRVCQANSCLGLIAIRLQEADQWYHSHQEVQLEMQAASQDQCRHWDNWIAVMTHKCLCILMGLLIYDYIPQFHLHEMTWRVTQWQQLHMYTRDDLNSWACAYIILCLALFSPNNHFWSRVILY